MLQIVRDACEAAGGIDALAEFLGIRRQAFYQWPRVPADRVIPIELATGGKVTRERLRPDLYPDDQATARSNRTATQSLSAVE